MTKHPLGLPLLLLRWTAAMVVVFALLSAGAVLFNYALGRHTTIAFVSTHQIYLMDTDHMHTRRIVSKSIAECCMVWSPDGTQVAYAVPVGIRFGIPSFELYVDDIGRDQPAMLVNDAISSRVAWSPDGSRLVFAGVRDSRPAIEVIHADGSNRQWLNEQGQIQSSAPWSPDGMWIVFVSQSGDADSEIRLVSADGAEVRQLTDNEANEYAPAWSPDGQQILFVSDRDGNLEIYTMNIDGSEQRRFTTNPLQDTGFEWSEDGRQFVYVAQLSDTNLDIYLMTADGSDTRRLTDTEGEDHFPQLSPDGSQIVFESSRDRTPEIYVMSADGSDVRRLTENFFAETAPMWLPLINPFLLN